MNGVQFGAVYRAARTPEERDGHLVLSGIKRRMHQEGRTNHEDYIVVRDRSQDYVLTDEDMDDFLLVQDAQMELSDLHREAASERFHSGYYCPNEGIAENAFDLAESLASSLRERIFHQAGLLAKAKRR